jgi:hypothetical protein
MNRRALAWTSVLVVLASVIGMSLIRPSSSRNWSLDHQRLPLVKFSGDQVQIDNVRNFRSVSADSVTTAYYSATYDLGQLESLWFDLAIFDGDGFRGPAHSMLSFGFSDGRYLVISVEARKEVGESYSIYRGVLKRYELIYVIGDEADLVRTRAAFREDQVYVYPIRTSPKKIRELFEDMLRSANTIHEQPQFYNTIWNNCTTVLRDHVNRITPGRIPHSWKVLLPGYADELLESLELLDMGLSVEEARSRYWINEKALAAVDALDFSAKIRAR